MGKFQYILKDLRKAQNLTQEDLSKNLKLSRSTVGMYENGSREPDFETLELIADFFNVDIDYLIGRTNKTTYIPQSTIQKESFTLSKEEKLIVTANRSADEIAQAMVLRALNIDEKVEQEKMA